MGVIWGKYAAEAANKSLADDEVYWTRRKLANVRREALRKRSALEYSMEPLLDTSPLPSHILSNMKGLRWDLLTQIQSNFGYTNMLTGLNTRRYEIRYGLKSEVRILYVYFKVEDTVAFYYLQFGDNFSKSVSQFHDFNLVCKRKMGTISNPAASRPEFIIMVAYICQNLSIYYPVG